MYPRVDGEDAYVMIRHLQPKQIIEVGASSSTLGVSDAVARDIEEGDSVVRRIFDPFPSPSTATAGLAVEPVPAQQIPPETFTELQSGDCLMIDTTHTVKLGGEVVYLLLEVLPALAPGVIVHIHDFFRPYEYPRWLLDHYALYWQEPYLLQAFLAFNSAFEVLIANCALTRALPAEVAKVIPGADAYPDEAPGSALWIRPLPDAEPNERPHP